jgi:hypothetical protein
MRVIFCQGLLLWITPRRGFAEKQVKGGSESRFGLGHCLIFPISMVSSTRERLRNSSVQPIGVPLIQLELAELLKAPVLADRSMMQPFIELALPVYAAGF